MHGFHSSQTRSNRPMGDVLTYTQTQMAHHSNPMSGHHETSRSHNIETPPYHTRRAASKGRAHTTPKHLPSTPGEGRLKGARSRNIETPPFHTRRGASKGGAHTHSIETPPYHTRRAASKGGTLTHRNTSLPHPARGDISGQAKQLVQISTNRYHRHTSG